ncbi:MAG: TonB-dependent receptor [Burkholderiaceae bacterium]
MNRSSSTRAILSLSTLPLLALLPLPAGAQSSPPASPPSSAAGSTAAPAVAGAATPATPASAATPAGASAHHDDDHALEQVVITANPLGSSRITPPASVLQGRDLTLRQARTIGETLDGLPGVSSTYFGPGASRPIIRGLDGDRIRLLQNGVGALDASALSYDHAVPQDVLSVDRVEVLRGPAALLYGGNAIGGVVNTIDNRIPREPVDSVGGEVDLGYGGAARERSLAGRVTGGNGQFAISADGFTRRSSDLRIPGYAWSKRQRMGQGSFASADDQEGGGADGNAAANARRRLPNSNGHAEGGSMGASWTTANGYLGMSYGAYRSEYGSVAEPSVRLKMQQDKLNFAGEQRNLSGPFSAIRFNLAYTDYEHREIEDGEVGTTFRNRGFEGRIEARHAPLGKLEGTVGLQVNQSRFSALGEEAFVPTSRTRGLALFAVEEYAASDALTLSFGGRYEHTELSPEAQGNERFADARRRSFGAGSVSTGARYRLDKQWTLDGNLAYVERAPTYYELYANGMHVATGVFELGDNDARKERSVSIDAGVGFDDGQHSGRVGVFYTRFQNYLGLSRSGNLCAEEGGEMVCSAAIDEGRAEYVYAGVPARFYGVEAQSRLHLGRIGGGHYDLELRGDLTRATNRDTGEALPRIPPVRVGAALTHRQGAWRTRLDVQHAFAQDHVPSNDVRTDGYTLVGASIAYGFKVGGTYWETYLRGTNLTNADARLATSILRDIAPLGGRALWVGARMVF